MKPLWITAALCLFIGFSVGVVLRSKGYTIETTSLDEASQVAQRSTSADRNALEAELEWTLDMLAEIETQEVALQAERDELRRHEAMFLAVPPGRKTEAIAGESAGDHYKRQKAQAKKDAMLNAIRDGIGFNKEMTLGVFAEEYFDWDAEQKQGVENALDKLWTPIREYEAENAVIVEETPMKVAIEVKANPELVDAALAQLSADLQASVGKEAADIMLRDASVQAFRERWGGERTITFTCIESGVGKQWSNWNINESRGGQLFYGGGFADATVPPLYQHLFTVE
ncbi:hypothetical protein [Cerasicoccus fimbriatus]|uniref:hypothetical protein n=1 Tax=Cerasicoccus fimbriatus TaxID=3014554 RepID=UPI0022B44426|nr:hypothetical protein [Cerasicoccus sp. TK19100]